MVSWRLFSLTNEHTEIISGIGFITYLICVHYDYETAASMNSGGGQLNQG